MKVDPGTANSTRAQSAKVSALYLCGLFAVPKVMWPFRSCGRPGVISWASENTMRPRAIQDLGIIKGVSTSRSDLGGVL